MGLVLGACAMLAGCGVGEDSYAPGTWELEGWMDVDGYGETGQRQTDTVRITPEMSGFGVRAVTFSKFYHGQTGENVVFENGEISGFLDQQAVAPFPAHQQAVSGWYRPDAFEMRITMPPIAGTQAYQVVSGQLVQPE